jgi:hypothetical protein
MSDKTEYSRLLLKRTGTPGVVPTIPTGNTLSTFIDTDTFIGEIFVNVNDDSAWIRTNNGQIPLLVSGSTFSGGSGNCIADLYITNLHGCSPITIFDDIILDGSVKILGDTSKSSLSLQQGLSPITKLKVENPLDATDVNTINSTYQGTSIVVETNGVNAATFSIDDTENIILDIPSVAGNLPMNLTIAPGTFSVFTSNNISGDFASQVIFPTNMGSSVVSNTTFLSNTYTADPSTIAHRLQTLDTSVGEFTLVALDSSKTIDIVYDDTATSTIVNSINIVPASILLQATTGGVGSQIQLGSTGGIQIDPSASAFLKLLNIPAFANDANAGGGGLTTGDIFQTDGSGAAPLNAAGILMIKQ